MKAQHTLRLSMASAVPVTVLESSTRQWQSLSATGANTPGDAPMHSFNGMDSQARLSEPMIADQHGNHARLLSR